MKRITPMIVLTSAVLAISGSAAFARGGNGNGPAAAGGPSVNSHAMANSNGPFATDRDFGRDRAEDRMSGKGALNSNGPGSADRDFGRDRAEDRMSAEGKAHAKAKVKKPKSVALGKTKRESVKPATPATSASPDMKSGNA